MQFFVSSVVLKSPPERKAENRKQPLFWHSMNLDFYQLYRNYSNTELLKIVKQPGDYQTSAVTAATQILNERQVTAEEIQLIEQRKINDNNSNII